MAEKRTQLETVIQTAINSALKDVHTCLPAVVTKVNSSTQLIDAQITIKRKMAGELILLPLLVDVPIRYFKTATFSITAPIEVGDHVEIRFCERSIDTWLTEGGIQNPSDFRKFSLSDAFATPAMYPQTDVIPNFNSTDLEIKTNSGDTKIIVKKSEDVEIVTTGEVKADCDTLLAEVADSATISCDELIAAAAETATVSCKTLNVAATTAVNITSPLTTITGNLTVTGTITAGAIAALSALTVTALTVVTSLLAAGKQLVGHSHPQGPDSPSGDTQQNTGGNL